MTWEIVTGCKTIKSGATGRILIRGPGQTGALSIKEDRLIHQDKIPVTIITGGLGAGKTTLINRILSENRDTKFAVIENEFGEIGIDQELVGESGITDIIEISDGCICCTVRSDLAVALEKIWNDYAPEHLLIETTGLAEPGPVAQVLMTDSLVTSRFYLGAVIAVTDAEYLMADLDREPVTASQAGFADVLILNKLDRIDTERQIEIKGRLRQMNPNATILETSHVAVETGPLLALDCFSPDRSLTLESEEDSVSGVPETGLTGLLDRMPSYRDEISSVGIVVPGSLDERKLEAWLMFLIDILGEDMLRIKGILSIEGKAERFVIQGVHSTLTGKDAQPWGDSERVSRILFIGRFPDRKMLEEGFKSCLVA